MAYTARPATATVATPAAPTRAQEKRVRPDTVVAPECGLGSGFSLSS